MHLHNCTYFQKHLRMLLKSLRVHCKAPGGPGSIWKYFEALVRATGVSGRCACGFWTDLDFADEYLLMILHITSTSSDQHNHATSADVATPQTTSVSLQIISPPSHNILMPFPRLSTSLLFRNTNCFHTPDTIP